LILFRAVSTEYNYITTKHYKNNNNNNSNNN